MFKYLIIDPERNHLLCDVSLVGKGEMVEIFELDRETPPQTTGRLMIKAGEPNLFEVCQSFDGHDALGRQYRVGPRCILKILSRSLSGIRRRKFSSDEKQIVMENQKERFLARAKTGSVRLKRIREHGPVQKSSCKKNKN